ncbi:hypothetical protein MRY87_07655 [bacterium]|nr:hypothetical protein [bacterium]
MEIAYSSPSFIAPGSHALFLVSTENQVFLSHELQRVLERFGMSSEFVSIAHLYGQRASATLREKGDPFTEPPVAHPLEDWCERSYEERAPIYEEVQQWARAYLSDPRIHVLFVGNDVNSIEQIFLRTAERYGIRTVRFQDGIQNLRKNRRERDLRQPSLMPLIPCEGGAERYLLWSEHLRGEFEEAHLPGTVSVTGSMKHDDLQCLSRYIERRSPGQIRVGVAGQPFFRYGDMWAVQELSLYEHIVNLLLIRDEISVIFRPHPESAGRESYEALFAVYGGRVVLDKSPSLAAFLEEIDALFTVTSSVSADACAVGIPAYTLPYLRSPRTHEEVRQQDHTVRSAVQDEGFPFSSHQLSSAQPEKYAEKFVGIVDGGARERTAACLSEELASGKEVRSLSVVIGTEGADPVASLQTVLRALPHADGSGCECVVLERSPSGGMLTELLEKQGWFQEFSSLRFHRSQEGSLLGGLRELLPTLCGRDVLYLEAGTHLLPGAPVQLQHLFHGGEGDEDAYGAVSSWFLGRTSTEVAEGVVEIPPFLSLAELESFQSFGMTSYCFLTSREKLQAALTNEAKIHGPASLVLLSHLLQATGEGLCLYQGPLFATPYFSGSGGSEQLAALMPWYERRFRALPRLEEGEVLSRVMQHMREQRYVEAKELIVEYEKANELSEQLLYARALLEAKSGRRFEGIRDLEALLERNPSHRDAGALLEHLRMLKG